MLNQSWCTVAMTKKIGRPFIGAKKKSRYVGFKVDEDEYALIEKCSSKAGLVSVSKYIRGVVLRSAKRSIKD